MTSNAGRSSSSRNSAPFELPFPVLRRRLASEGIAASQTAREMLSAGRLNTTTSWKLRLSSLQTLIGSFFFFSSSFVGEIIVGFCCFFNGEMLSGSVRLHHRMSVKIPRAIPPLGRAALGRKRRLFAQRRTSDWKSSEVTFCFLLAAVAPLILSSLYHPSLIFCCFFFLSLSLVICMCACIACDLSGRQRSKVTLFQLTHTTVSVAGQPF